MLYYLGHKNGIDILGSYSLETVSQIPKTIECLWNI